MRGQYNSGAILPVPNEPDGPGDINGPGDQVFAFGYEDDAKVVCVLYGINGLLQVGSHVGGAVGRAGGEIEGFGIGRAVLIDGAAGKGAGSIVEARGFAHGLGVAGGLAHALRVAGGITARYGTRGARQAYGDY